VLADSPQDEAGSPARIRPLEPRDLPEVVRLHRAAFRPRSSYRFLERAYYPAFLDPGSGGFGFAAAEAERFLGMIVATTDDRLFHRRLALRHPFELALRAAGRAARGLVGGRRDRVVRAPVADLREDGVPRPAPRARIHYLAVHREARRQGLGRSLVETALAALGDSGVQACGTRIAAGNLASRALFESLGFERAVRPDAARAAIAHGGGGPERFEEYRWRAQAQRAGVRAADA